jgi:hypothetical protein
VASLNVDIDYFDHPKTKRLIGMLGRNSEVLPLRLWSYCGKFHAKDGRLTGYSTQEIESIVGWWGKPGHFVEAMITVRFLHAGKNTYQIHEWKEHQGHLHSFSIRGKTAAKARWKRIKEQCNKHALSNAKDMQEQCSYITKPTKHHPPNPPSGGNGQGPEKLPHGVSPEFWELAPENIRVDSMRELWSEWVEYRRERKPKVTSRSAKMQLAELAEMGIEQAKAAIRASIANGWQGIFPPRGNGKRVEAEDEFKPRAPTEDELKFLFPKEA